MFLIKFLEPLHVHSSLHVRQKSLVIKEHLRCWDLLQLRIYLYVSFWWILVLKICFKRVFLWINNFLMLKGLNELFKIRCIPITNIICLHISESCSISFLIRRFSNPVTDKLQWSVWSQDEITLKQCFLKPINIPSTCKEIENFAYLKIVVLHFNIIIIVESKFYSVKNRNSKSDLWRACCDLEWSNHRKSHQGNAIV